MDSIILELQALAASESSPVADLLRRARMVATKLGLDDFNRWIGHELHGYPEDAEVPKYRVMKGELGARNPYDGNNLMPVTFQPVTHDILATVEFRNSIGELEKVTALSTTVAEVPFSQSQLAIMRKMFQPDEQWITPFRRIAVTQLEAVFEAVRNLILDWALRLETEGILGDGLSFTKDEKTRANESPQIQIGHFQGILGDVTGSKVNQTLHMDVVEGDLPSLDRFLEALKVCDEDRAELQDALTAEPAPSADGKMGNRVGAWIGKMVKKAAVGAWEVSVAKASDLLFTGIQAYYGL